eukprot:6191359-Pleurochrysis_carterae.AAC.1
MHYLLAKDMHLSVVVACLCRASSCDTRASSGSNYCSCTSVAPECRSASRQTALRPLKKLQLSQGLFRMATETMSSPFEPPSQRRSKTRAISYLAQLLNEEARTVKF